MRSIRPRESRAPADATGWLLGTIVVVLTVLDLLIWGSLWNVPDPISKFLAPAAVADGMPNAAASPFDDKDAAALIGMPSSSSETSSVR